MATYIGAIISETHPTILQQRIFTDTELIQIEKDEQHATLVQRVFNAELSNMFIIGASGESGSKPVRILKGHTTWGDGNTPPRLHPLETSWTRKRV